MAPQEKPRHYPGVRMKDSRYPCRLSLSPRWLPCRGGRAGLSEAGAAAPVIAVTGGLTGQGFGRGGEAIVTVGNNVITCNDNWEATSRMTGASAIWNVQRDNPYDRGRRGHWGRDAPFSHRGDGGLAGQGFGGGGEANVNVGNNEFTEILRSQIGTSSFGGPDA